MHVFGSFGSAYAGDGFRSVLRLDRAGARDPEFSANAEKVSIWPLRSPGLQWDGRIVSLAYSGTSTNGRYGLRRLLPNGQSDPSPLMAGGFSNTITAVRVDPIGRLLAVGKFRQFRTNAAPGWVRLMADGSWDSSFVPTLDGTAFSALEVTQDGRILALDGTTLRLFGGGGASLGTVASNVTAFALEPAGSILVGSTELPRLWRVSLGDPPRAQVEFVRGYWAVPESAASVVLKIQRIGNAQPVAEVDYQVMEPPLSVGMNPGALSGTVRFAEGQSEAELVLPLDAKEASSVEDRVFSVQLADARGATVSPGRDAAVVGVWDEDSGLVAEVFQSARYGLLGSPPGTLQSTGVAYLERREIHRDRQVFFEWGTGGPDSVAPDMFAMIWSGWVVPEASGSHQFGVWADDGSRIWVDDEVVLDHWVPQSPALVTGSSVPLQAGKAHRLCLHMHEQWGTAMCRLVWKPPGTTNWVTVPRQVLRPGTPRGIAPTLAVSLQADQQFRFDVTGEPGRPVRLEVSTNGVTWSPIAEVNHSATKVTNTFLRSPASTMPVGARVRAVSVDDGLADPGYVFPLAAQLSTGGRTNLVEGATNALVLYASANGGPGQVVRWWRNGVPTTNGVSGTRLTLTGVDPDAVGEYHFTVDAAGLRAESRRLGIGYALKPTIGPTTNLTLQAGMPAVLRLPVTGSEPLTYVWSRDGSPVPGGVSATLSIPQVSAADAGMYLLTVTNFVGQATSGVIAVRVVPPGSLQPTVRWNQGQVVAEMPVNPGPYAWQESGDLKSWMTILRVEVREGLFVSAIGSPTQEPARFYRLVPSP